MAKRRPLKKRRILIFRVTVPDFDEVTQWAKTDGKYRAEILRELFQRERERRAQEQLDRMAEADHAHRMAA